MPITHAKVSGKSDGADATQIQPSDWNDEHVGATGAESPLVLTSNDPAEIPLTLVPDAGQTEALLVVQNESAGEAVEAFANGSINQYLTDPAVIGWLIKMAADQTASPLQVMDSNNNVIFDFDPVNGNIAIRVPGGHRTDWYVQETDNYVEADLRMAVGGIAPVEIDSYSDKNVAANSYTTITVKAQPSQNAATPLLLLTDSSSATVFEVFPTGGIKVVLPTSNPGAGLLWNDGGTVKVGT